MGAENRAWALGGEERGKQPGLDSSRGQGAESQSDDWVQKVNRAGKRSSTAEARQDLPRGSCPGLKLTAARL